MRRIARPRGTVIHDFDPQGVVSIFSTHEQSRVADEYFLSSGDKIRFFFEEDAFLPDGTLKQAKEQSINKIGHALHDLDPVFNKFSRTPAIRSLVTELGIEQPLLLQGMYIFKQPRIGGEVSCHQDSTFLYTEPQNSSTVVCARRRDRRERLPVGHPRRAPAGIEIYLEAKRGRWDEFRSV